MKDMGKVPLSVGLSRNTLLHYLHTDAKSVVTIVDLYNTYALDTIYLFIMLHSSSSQLTKLVPTNNAAQYQDA